MVKRFTLLALVALALCGCDDPDTARHTLQSAGYTDITVGGFAPLYCGRDDLYATKFHAKNWTGQYVDGVVCSGVTKGATIRF